MSSSPTTTITEMQIASIELNETKQDYPNSGTNLYVFNFSSAGSQEWVTMFKNNFNQSEFRKNKTLTIKSIEQKQLRVVCSSEVEPQALLDALKAIVNQTNDEQDTFKTKLKNLKF